MTHRQFRSYMRRAPFSGLIEDDLLVALQPLPEAAYLYDAVMLYAQALVETLGEGGNTRQGSCEGPEMYKIVTLVMARAL